MADRIIRDEIWDSERFLSLKDNADRLAFLRLLNACDGVGNFEAHQAKLLRLWRDFGISTPELVGKTLLELTEHDMVRLYEVDGKRYGHIPRTRWHSRYLKRIHPLPPDKVIEKKQADKVNAQRERMAQTEREHGLHGDRTAGVGVGVGVIDGVGVGGASNPPTDERDGKHGEMPIGVKTVLGNLTGKSKPASKEKPMTREEQLAYVASAASRKP